MNINPRELRPGDRVRVNHNDEARTIKAVDGDLVSFEGGGFWRLDVLTVNWELVSPGRDASPLADLIAVERSGHRSQGYTCECGVKYSNRRPTADHIDHVRTIADNCASAS